MNQLTNKTVSVAGAGSIVDRPAAGDLMNALIKALIKLGILKEDLDYYLIRAAMIIIFFFFFFFFFFFGYQKWFAYEAQVLIPYISNGPLIFWMYPVFGIRGAS
jgi:uncharacterized membrane protein YkgB